MIDIIIIFLLCACTIANLTFIDDNTLKVVSGTFWLFLTVRQASDRLLTVNVEVLRRIEKEINKEEKK